MGKIARVFKVSTVTVLKWVRSAAQGLEPIDSKTSSGIIILDELWHFVNGKKNKVWIWIDGVSRRSLGWELGPSRLTPFHVLVERIDNGSCDFVTDLWLGFFSL